MAGTTLQVVEVTNITAPHRLHHLRQGISRLRCGQQVKVVGHQHPGMNGHAKFFGVDAQQVEQCLILGYS